MTADPTATGAEGVLTALRRLRDQWVLVVALASALFWARDLAVVYARLPDEVDRQAEAQSRLAARVAGIEARLGAAGAGDPPASAPRIDPGPLADRPGAGTAARWRRVLAAGPDCAARSAPRPPVGGRGRGQALDTRPGTGPGTSGEPVPALGVKPHARMGVGRAGVRLRVTVHCPGRAGQDSPARVRIVLPARRAALP